MPELRKDPIVGRWVIVAPDRARRPEDYAPEFKTTPGHFCPFCEGNEEATPPEILAERAPGSERDRVGWRVRVVPNKFPALEAEGDLSRRGNGMYEVMNAVGAHEVIIETPRHETRMSRLSVENICEVLTVYRNRLAALKAAACRPRTNPRLVYGLIFKNEGAAAGASLEHTHSQLIATPVVPISIREELDGSLEFHRDRGRCIYCEMIEQELATAVRIVLETPGFVVFCPFAGRFPFETWILPRQHAGRYEDIRQQQIGELGMVLSTLLRKLEAALDDPPYNFVIHTTPFDTDELEHYHWHIELFPRVTRVAGFEWGSGFYINPVPPEEAARSLREVGTKSPPRP